MDSIFREEVYRVVKTIPIGKVMTYQQVASLVHRPKAYRSVGYHLKHNPHIPCTPCHRVVGSDGCLVGYAGAGGLITKRKLLAAEGVVFKGRRVNLAISQVKS